VRVFLATFPIFVNKSRWYYSK